MENNIERLQMLRVPFEAHHISKLPKPYKKDSLKGQCDVCGGYHGLPALHLDYVGHAALTDRLLDVDPAWSWEPLSLDERGLPALDKDGGLWIKLTVCGVTRLGYGDAQGKTGGDAMKERIGDALRNAAMRFGAALDLWHKGVLHVDEEAETKPEPKAPAKPAAKPPAQKPLTDMEIDDVMLAMVESSDLDDLKQVFGPAYQKANAAQRPKLKDAYDRRKAQLEEVEHA